MEAKESVEGGGGKGAWGGERLRGVGVEGGVCGMEEGVYRMEGGVHGIELRIHEMKGGECGKGGENNYVREMEGG